MDKDYMDFFDSLPEEEIFARFPEELPAMGDELAAKRIGASVMGAVKAGRKRRWGGKQIAAAACCFLVLGAAGHGPILAAFQRVFHVLPGVGLYINDSEEEILEVRLLNPVQEKDGVRVELKDFYCKGVAIYGLIDFTGDRLPDEEEGGQELREVMKERFPITWFDGEREWPFASSGGGSESQNGKTTRYYCNVVVSRERGTEPRGRYEFRIGGLDEPFVFEVIDPQTLKDVEKLGYTMTKNDTTVSARAYLREDGIEVEYYVVPSEEVSAMDDLTRREYIPALPYRLDMEHYYYFRNAAGERMEEVKGGFKRLLNGCGFLLEGTAEDFPLTLHRGRFSGTDGETHTVDLPLPANGEKLTENLPKVEFHYGTVEFLSVERSDVVWKDDNEDSERAEDATKVTYAYRIRPKEGIREMYAVRVDTDSEAYEASYGSGGVPDGAGWEERIWEESVFLPRTGEESISLTLEYPSYWIEGDYDIVIKKPEKG